MAHDALTPPFSAAGREPLLATDDPDLESERSGRDRPASLDVRRVTAAEWNALLDRTAYATGFHRAEALDVLASASDSRLHRLVAFEADDPVGLYPLFTKTVGPVASVFSPPPRLKVPYLGPLLIETAASARTRERRNAQFVAGVDEWIADRFRPVYATTVTVPGYVDVRPFEWNRYDVTPRFTYEIDLGRGREALLAAFSRNARRNVTNTSATDYEITVGDAAAIESIHDIVVERYADQGASFPVCVEVVTALYDALPDGVVRPYTCCVDGRVVGGLVAVAYADRVMAWLAGADHSADCPVSDLLHWRALTDGIDDGRRTYDLVGSNNPRISRYKAKFSPELATYYRTERAVPGMRRAAGMYKYLQD